MGELAPEIEKLVAFAESMGTVRIDLGKIASITASEAALLAAALQRLRKAGTPMWFNNTAPLEQVLRAAFNERASDAIRSFWMLLFELYVLEGRNEPFEELGLEYAVAFEISPPIWEVYVNSVAQATARSAAAPAAAAAPPAPPAGAAAAHPSRPSPRPPPAPRPPPPPPPPPPPRGGPGRRTRTAALP